MAINEGISPANEDLFKGSEGPKNYEVFYAVDDVVRDVAAQTFAQPAVKGFFSKYQQKLVDYGKKKLDGCLPDGSSYAVYDRGVILKQYHGPAWCEAELEPHQVAVLVARLFASDYPTYQLLQGDLQYLKLLMEPKKE